MKKVLKVFGLTILFLFIIYLIYAFTIENRVLMSIEIETYIPIFAKMEEKDNHGGFHGDGESLAKIYFSENQAKKFIEKIEKNEHWRELPMTETLQGYANYSYYEGMEIPFVENGYWFVLDRHSKATNKYDENGIFEEGRYSRNYSVAVFDTDANILYYSEEDT